MKQTDTHKDRDPLNLGRLPLLEPEADGWPGVKAALQADRRRKSFHLAGRWAAAAGLVLAVGLFTVHMTRQAPSGADPQLTESSVGQPGTAVAPGESGVVDAGETPAIADFVALSQTLERRLRGLRDQTGSLSGEAVIYIAELEDMVARVDGAISEDPGSVDLWGQRVNLLLDLEMIYQHHWEREYGRMAAL